MVTTNSAQDKMLLASGPMSALMVELPASWAAATTNTVGVMQKTKLLQSQQWYSMLLYHKPTKTYHELIDDTLNTLQLIDSTITNETVSARVRWFVCMSRLFPARSHDLATDIVLLLGVSNLFGDAPYARSLAPIFSFFNLR